MRPYSISEAPQGAALLGDSSLTCRPLRGSALPLRDQLAAYAIKDLENEIAALNSKLARARSLRSAEDPSLVRKVQAVLAEAQSLHARLNGDVTPLTASRHNPR